MDVILVTFAAIAFSIAGFRLVRPTGAPQTYWMLQFKFPDHFLLLLIIGRLEARTVLDTFRCAHNTSLVCRFVAHRTHLLAPLVNDSSILGLSETCDTKSISVACLLLLRDRH